MKLFSLAAAAVTIIFFIANAAQAQTFESSSCWEMTSSKPFAGGKASDVCTWRLLGGCTVTVQPDGLPSALWIAETKLAIPVTNFSWLKPYQNPTGMSLAGSWVNSTGTRAVFAIKTL